MLISLATIEVCVFCAVASVAALFYFVAMAVVANIFKHYYKGECKIMPDYEKMYKTMLDGVEKAIEELKKVEVVCEEIYINTSSDE